MFPNWNVHGAFCRHALNMVPHMYGGLLEDACDTVTMPTFAFFLLADACMHHSPRTHEYSCRCGHTHKNKKTHAHAETHLHAPVYVPICPRNTDALYAQHILAHTNTRIDFGFRGLEFSRVVCKAAVVINPTRGTYDLTYALPGCFN